MRLLCQIICIWPFLPADSPPRFGVMLLGSWVYWEPNLAFTVPPKFFPDLHPGFPVGSLTPGVWLPANIGPIEPFSSLFFRIFVFSLFSADKLIGVSPSAQPSHLFISFTSFVASVPSLRTWSHVVFVLTEGWVQSPPSLPFFPESFPFYIPFDVSILGTSLPSTRPQQSSFACGLCISALRCVFFMPDRFFFFLSPTPHHPDFSPHEFAPCLAKDCAMCFLCGV